MRLSEAVFSLQLQIIPIWRQPATPTKWLLWTRNSIIFEQNHCCCFRVSQVDLKMLVCHFPDCLFKTRYKFNLSRHLRTHKIYGNFSYTCVHCEAKFFTAATLGKHKRICKKVSISAAPSSQKNYSLNVHIPSKNTNPKDPSSTSCETDTLRGTDIVAPP